MANVKLKSDFKDGEVLFGEQLNNNFKAIEAALAALNKVSWQDNLDEELVVFKGTTFEIENRSIVSGQILYDIEKDIVYLDVATGTNALDTIYQRINMSGGVKTITEGDLGDITEVGIYLIKTGTNITDNKGSGETIEEIRKYDSILIVGKNEDNTTIWQSIEQGFSKFYRTLTYINGNVTEVRAWEKQEVGIPRLKNKDMSELTKPGIYLLDHDTTTDNLREGSTIAISYFDYFIVVRQWTDTTMLQYSWDNTMTSAYWRMLHLDEDGKPYSATEWSITKEGLPVIDKGDYADVTQEGLYLVKGNNITDRLSMIAGTLNTNHNKFMYVSKSSGSAAPNIKQNIIDGFDMYVRVVYLDSSGNASRSDGWEKRTIGEGGSGGSANIYIGEEEPTDGSNVWIDPSDDGTVDGLLNMLFPIGKVEIFFDDLDHSNHLGFVWERTSVGRFPIGAGTGTDSNNDTKTVTVGQKGGAYRHTLAINEMPSHNHIQYLNGNSQNPAGNGAAYSWINSNQRYSYEGTDLAAKSGGGQPHNNIPPYEAMAFWKRIG